MSRTELRVKVQGGALVAVYDDRLVGLMDKGDARVLRASHVEPATSIGWECDGWIADMKPVGGPLLFAQTVAGVKQPFRTRAAALEAERAWLRVHFWI